MLNLIVKNASNKKSVKSDVELKEVLDELIIIDEKAGKAEDENKKRRKKKIG